MNNSHVTIQNTPDGGYLLRCQHCSAELRPKLPISLDAFGHLCKSFGRTHKGCQRRPTAVFPVEELLLVETSIKATTPPL